MNLKEAMEGWYETIEEWYKTRENNSIPPRIAEIFNNRDIIKKASYLTKKGLCFNEDSLLLMKNIKNNSINLILTSPPFALVSQKEYGNRVGDEYVEWFMKFLYEFKRIITKDGSIVIDFGSAYIQGNPVKSIYQYEILLRACKLVYFYPRSFFTIIRQNYHPQLYGSIKKESELKIQ
jgi:hypothetical protein